ncbi:hypothetical protein Dimus_011808 [Dionaea muscipula]
MAEELLQVIQMMLETASDLSPIPLDHDLLMDNLSLSDQRQAAEKAERKQKLRGGGREARSSFLLLRCTMADFSLSQGLSHTSDEEEDEDQHSPPPHQTLITSVIHCPTASTTARSSSSSRPRMNSTHIVQTPPASGADALTSTPPDTGRKPRGRPPGSKNKPKPPVYITREAEPAAKTQQLEIPSGLDIVEMVQRFAAKHHVGVNIINGFGSISNVVLKYPGIQGQSISLSGTFELLSVSGMFMGPSVPCNSKEKSSSCGSHYLAVFLAGNGAQVFGGVAMGKVVAASNVVLNVCTFANYEFHRLCPAAAGDEGDDAVESKPNVRARTETAAAASSGMHGHGGRGGAGACQSPSPVSSHVPEVLNWAPAARSPHF